MTRRPLLGVVVCYLGATLRQWNYRQRLEQLGFERPAGGFINLPARCCFHCCW